jgi:hypothetical protein
MEVVGGDPTHLSLQVLKNSRERRSVVASQTHPSDQIATNSGFEIDPYIEREREREREREGAL